GRGGGRPVGRGGSGRRRGRRHGSGRCRGRGAVTRARANKHTGTDNGQQSKGSIHRSSSLAASLNVQGILAPAVLNRELFRSGSKAGELRAGYVPDSVGGISGMGGIRGGGYQGMEGIRGW